MNSQQVHDRAEASFKKKESLLLDGQKAMADYNAVHLAEREKTARLRAFRLARAAADTMRRVPTEGALRRTAMGDAAMVPRPEHRHEQHQSRPDQKRTAEDSRGRSRADGLLAKVSFGVRL
jgi:hypothetical protein